MGRAGARPSPDAPLHGCATYEVVSPRELALHVLHARFGRALEDTHGAHDVSDVVLAPHQVDAVATVEAIIARYGGAIVADGVGLGKTFVALAVVDRAVTAGTLVQVVVPASLRMDWRRHLERVCTGAQKARRVRLLTHTHLSRIPSDAALPLAGLVVVDEAHAFRHPDTRRYASLARLCAGAKVLLVTATPVSNSILDFYHLIHLFAGNDAFVHLGVADLTALFRAAARNEVSLEPVTRVIRAVTVRRTRAFLRSNYGGLFIPGGASVTFPRAAPPVAVRYAHAANALQKALHLLHGLRFTAARAARIDLNGAGGADLLRFLLLKRLDSSAAAFQATLERQIAFHQRFLDHLTCGRLLTMRADLSRARGGDALQLSFDELVTERVPAGIHVGRMHQDVRTDLRTLHELRDVMTPAVQNDAKLAALQRLLLHQLEGHKVLVFTEFRDTARHVWRALAALGGVALVVGDESRLGLMLATRSAVITRFAPLANHARMPVAREAVRWLIATDVLSEGLNLQDADVVVSYDLPWNPVRLLQRVGRIDRIGSVHATVRSFHFLPEDGLEHMLGLVGRLARKADTIRRTVGDDESLVGLSRAADVVGRLNRSDASAFDVAEHDALLDADTWERCRLLYLSAVRDGWRPRTNGADIVSAMTEQSASQTCAFVMTDGYGWAISPAGKKLPGAKPSLDAVLARCVESDPPGVEPDARLVNAALDIGRTRMLRNERRAFLKPAVLPQALLRVRRLASRLPLDTDLCARLDRLSLAARSCEAGGEEVLEQAWRGSGLAERMGLPELQRFLDKAEATLRPRVRPTRRPATGTMAVLEIRPLGRGIEGALLRQSVRTLTHGRT